MVMTICLVDFCTVLAIFLMHTTAVISIVTSFIVFLLFPENGKGYRMLHE